MAHLRLILMKAWAIWRWCRGFNGELRLKTEAASCFECSNWVFGQTDNDGSVNCVGTGLLFWINRDVPSSSSSGEYFRSWAA